MFFSRNKTNAQMYAIRDYHAVAEFSLEGTVMAASSAFVATLGYRADELIGRQHSTLLEASERDRKSVV